MGLNVRAHFKAFNCKESGEEDLYVLTFHIPKARVTAEAMAAMHTLQGKGVVLSAIIDEQAEYEKVMAENGGQRSLEEVVDEMDPTPADQSAGPAAEEEANTDGAAPSDEEYDPFGPVADDAVANAPSESGELPGDAEQDPFGPDQAILRTGLMATLKAGMRIIKKPECRVEGKTYEPRLIRRVNTDEDLFGVTLEDDTFLRAHIVNTEYEVVE